MTRTHKETLRILRKTRFDYAHPVFYSRKSPALSELSDELAESLHNHLAIVKEQA